MKRTVSLLATTALALALAACSTGTPHAPKQAAPASASPWVSSSPADPNLPEVNAQGDIPDNQQYVPYTPPTGGFSVKVPEGWARTASPSSATFTDKLNSIRLDVSARPGAPTTASARAEVAALGTKAGHFTAGPVKTVTRKAGTAVVAFYRADAAADPVTGKVVNDDVERYQFWANGKLVTLTLGGPHGADNVDPWRIVTDSFRWAA
ncbi:MAG TPA: hypothetical protein VGD11_11290 [Mycobacteriales bacterium]